MNYSILAFDPGETTGIVFANWDLSTTPITYFDVLKATHVPFDLSTNIYDIIMTVKPQILIYERFALYKHKAMQQVNSEFPTVEIIGYIKLAYVHLTRTEHVCKLVKQPASVMERVEISPQHELQLRGKRHATSAYKHIRYYIINHFVEFSRLS